MPLSYIVGADKAGKATHKDSGHFMIDKFETVSQNMEDRDRELTRSNVFEVVTDEALNLSTGIFALSCASTDPTH